MSKALRIDLNADVGESFGAVHVGDDEPIFRYVTSANVACGLHAGNPAIIAATIAAAARHHVSVGAHPSYPDAAGFGRQTMEMEPDELRSVIVYQIGAVAAVARLYGVQLTHVKPHGALYSDAARNAALAIVVANAIATFDRNLILVGLAGSHSTAAGKAAGLRVAAEAFCDRTYESDGTLRSRAFPDALIEDPRQAAAQAVEIAVKHQTHSATGEVVNVNAQTLCVHGDSRAATAKASAIRAALTEAGVQLTNLSDLEMTQ